MKKYFIMALIPCIAFFIAVSRPSEAAVREGGKISVVASLFPQYDFARRIGGDRADVSLLLPPGAESHTYEPRPADMARIAAADMFVYTGKYMEPWADRLISGLSNGPFVVDASFGIELAKADEDDGHEGHLHAHDSHEHGGYDPHFWLDPTLAAKMAENIGRAMSEADPDGAEIYSANAARLARELRELDDEMKKIVAGAKRRTLVFGSRFAYMYFIRRYDLDYVTAYHSCGAQAEPSVRDVMEVVRFVRDNEIPCIYHEELSDPKVARTIASETGADLLLFATAHNVSKDDLESGVSFVDIMRKNIENVKRGLE